MYVYIFVFYIYIYIIVLFAMLRTLFIYLPCFFSIVGKSFDSVVRLAFLLICFVSWKLFNI